MSLRKPYYLDGSGEPTWFTEQEFRAWQDSKNAGLAKAREALDPADEIRWTAARRLHRESLVAVHPEHGEATDDH